MTYRFPILFFFFFSLLSLLLRDYDSAVPCWFCNLRVLFFFVFCRYQMLQGMIWMSRDCSFCYGLLLRDLKIDFHRHGCFSCSCTPNFFFVEGRHISRHIALGSEFGVTAAGHGDFPNSQPPNGTAILVHLYFRGFFRLR